MIRPPRAKAVTLGSKKIAMDQAITENWSTGATIGLMPQVNAIKAAGLKCVVVWLTPQDQAAFVQDLHSVGYDATVFGNVETNADDTFAKLAGDLADGVVTAALTSGLHQVPSTHNRRPDFRQRNDITITAPKQPAFGLVALHLCVRNNTKVGFKVSPTRRGRLSTRYSRIGAVGWHTNSPRRGRADLAMTARAAQAAFCISPTYACVKSAGHRNRLVHRTRTSGACF